MTSLISFARPRISGSPGLAPHGMPAAFDQNAIRIPGGLVNQHGETKTSAKVLGRLGSLEVRLARTDKEMRRAQRLRYKVFYEEM